MDKFDAMQIFVRVVDRGSFSAVAKERGIGQPAVSKQISALEHNLGIELIHRTSRSIILTEAGRDFYESALRILDDFENATSRITRGQTALKGLLRVTVPPTFARLHMVSKLPAFFAAYPDLAIEMAASESATTIMEDGLDLAIHSGDLSDSNLVARRFAQTMIIVVATPQYLMRHGAPESPNDLGRFRSVVLVERGSVQPWKFGSGKDEKRVIPQGVFRTSDIEQMRMGVLEHLGMAQAPAWLFAAELREGTVIRLLTAWSESCRSWRCGLRVAGFPVRFGFSLSIWKRRLRSVRSSIRELLMLWKARGRDVHSPKKLDRRALVRETKCASPGSVYVHFGYAGRGLLFKGAK